MGLEHKVLAALGLGRLGAKAATVGGAFDMTVIAWSQNLTAGGRKDDSGLRPFEAVQDQRDPFAMSRRRRCSARA
jgi:phosphoglycerate dehydrogenase-like enzyme